MRKKLLCKFCPWENMSLYEIIETAVWDIEFFQWVKMAHNYFEDGIIELQKTRVKFIIN